MCPGMGWQRGIVLAVWRGHLLYTTGVSMSADRLRRGSLIWLQAAQRQPDLAARWS